MSPSLCMLLIVKITVEFVYGDGYYTPNYATNYPVVDKFNDKTVPTQSQGPRTNYPFYKKTWPINQNSDGYLNAPSQAQETSMMQPRWLNYESKTDKANCRHPRPADPQPPPHRWENYYPTKQQPFNRKRQSSESDNSVHMRWKSDISDEDVVKNQKRSNYYPPQQKPNSDLKNLASFRWKSDSSEEDTVKNQKWANYYPTQQKRSSGTHSSELDNLASLRWKSDNSEEDIIKNKKWVNYYRIPQKPTSQEFNNAKNRQQDKSTVSDDVISMRWANYDTLADKETCRHKKPPLPRKPQSLKPWTSYYPAQQSPSIDYYNQQRRAPQVPSSEPDNLISSRWANYDSPSDSANCRHTKPAFRKPQSKQPWTNYYPTENRSNNKPVNA